MTAQRVTYLYECMDSAYDAVQIHDHSQKHGRISIIDANPRSNKDLKESLARERKAADSAGFIIRQINAMDLYRPSKLQCCGKIYRSLDETT